MNPAVPAMQIVLGLMLLANGLNHFLMPLYPIPMGSTPLAFQFSSALADSRLADVAIGLQMIAGGLLLAGWLVPLALYAAMPVAACMMYWALVLERDPLWAMLAMAAFALNGLLMLAYLNNYRGVLQNGALALGENAKPGGNYDSLYARPIGRTPPAAFVLAMIPILGAAAFFRAMVPSILSDFCLMALCIPAAVLLARLLQDFRHKG